MLFALAFVNALLYIIQYKTLKKKNFNQKYFRIGSVATLEKIIFFSTLGSLVILILSVILIAQWGIYAVGIAIFKDPKVMLSVIITLLYTVYIVMYLKRKSSQLI